jgi:activator of 2-hydroxyglutaryl-CoA dehydratase
MVRALEAELGTPINVSPDGHFKGALGAALFALERAQAAGGEALQPAAAGRVLPC